MIGTDPHPGVDAGGEHGDDQQHWKLVWVRRIVSQEDGTRIPMIT